MVKWQQVQKSTLYTGSKGWLLCCNPHKSCLNWTKSSGRKWYQEAWYKNTESCHLFWYYLTRSFVKLYACCALNASSHLILLTTVTCTSLSLFLLFFSKSCQIVSYLSVSVPVTFSETLEIHHFYAGPNPSVFTQWKSLPKFTGFVSVYLPSKLSKLFKPFRYVNSRKFTEALQTKDFFQTMFNLSLKDQSPSCWHSCDLSDHDIVSCHELSCFWRNFWGEQHQV